MRRWMRRFLCRDQRGTTMVEAALVFPLVLTTTFGIIELANMTHQWLLAEKATEAGARFAVVSDMVATGVPDCGVSAGTAPAGTPCRLISGSTTWSHTCQAGSGGCDAAAFNAIVAEMQTLFPRITAANVVVEYFGTGLGFVGRGSPVPNVTVRLQGMTFNFVVMDDLAGLGPLTMPDFRATLTGEDLSS